MASTSKAKPAASADGKYDFPAAHDHMDAVRQEAIASRNVTKIAACNEAADLWNSGQRTKAVYDALMAL